MPTDVRARVRMYRQGLGDCFLVALPRSDGSTYFILLDCGVALGSPGGPARLTEAVADVVATTGGRVDLLIATHAHWDHVSGFLQASAEFARLHVAEVWLAWTEDPNNELAKRLVGEREAVLANLRVAATAMHLVGDDDNAAQLGSVLELFGDASARATTSAAMEAVRGLSTTVRYRGPEDAPVDLRDPPARLYVLGPPRDERWLRMTQATAGSGAETYSFAVDLPPLGPTSGGQLTPDAPFSSLYAIPWAAAQQMAFFQANYLGRDAWRRIDSAWLASSVDVGLALDAATNNTSLVLAVELADGAVLLFPGDAQVGSWLSWQDLHWQVDDRTVSGPDLLRRTIFYKVGHHGSYNGTPRSPGLDRMPAMHWAMIPVDHAVAASKGWPRLPLPALVDALRAQANGAVVELDQDVRVALPPGVVATDLYFEVTL